ncbi:MAG: hypothetical protein K0Q74_338, partial [Gammaproteobacteria bacterium]|nr:hypothetical protein [Gammaproteobacteria bacterium]
ACFGLGWVGLSAAVAAMFVGGAMAVINHVSSPEASDQPRNDTFSPPVGGSTWVWAIASMKDNGHHRRSIPQAVPSPVDQVAALASVPVDIPLEPVDRSALNDQSPSALALALDGKHNDQVSNKPIDQSVTPGEHEPGRPKTDKHVSGADWVSQNILAIQIPQDEGPKRDSYSPKRKGSEDTLESFSPTKKQRSSSSFSFATGTGTAADVREDQEEAFKVAVKCKL